MPVSGEDSSRAGSGSNGDLSRLRVRFSIPREEPKELFVDMEKFLQDSTAESVHCKMNFTVVYPGDSSPQRRSSSRSRSRSANPVEGGSRTPRKRYTSPSSVEPPSKRQKPEPVSLRPCPCTEKARPNVHTAENRSVPEKKFADSKNTQLASPRFRCTPVSPGRALRTPPIDSKDFPWRNPFATPITTPTSRGRGELSMSSTSVASAAIGRKPTWQPKRNPYSSTPSPTPRRPKPLHSASQIQKKSHLPTPPLSSPAPRKYSGMHSPSEPVPASPDSKPPRGAPHVPEKRLYNSLSEKHRETSTARSLSTPLRSRPPSKFLPPRAYVSLSPPRRPAPLPWPVPAKNYVDMDIETSLDEWSSSSSEDSSDLEHAESSKGYFKTIWSGNCDYTIPLICKASTIASFNLERRWPLTLPITHSMIINYRDKLPVEIWHHIFEIQAAQAEAHRILAEDFNSPNSTLNADPYAVPENLDSGVCFPYSIAASCHFFESVLAKIPAAWRRILVYLDDDEPQRTLEKFAERLQKAGVTATDILITRKNWHALAARPNSAPEVPPDPVEEEKVLSILPLIFQLAPSAASLTIRTISGDSLPDINHFSGRPYPDLHTLVLDCLNRGTGTLLPHETPEPEDSLDISLPSVHRLTLSGPNFGNLFKNSVWEAWYLTTRPTSGFPRFTKLRVSHWRTEDGYTSDDCILDTKQFFDAFFAGCHREAELAHMDCPRFLVDGGDMDSSPQYDSMMLENVSPDTFHDYLECMAEDDPNRFVAEFTHKVVNCTFGPDPHYGYLDKRAGIHGDSIVLIRMSDENSIKTCLDLAHDDVFGLWVSDSPGFTDSLVRYLGNDGAPCPRYSEANTRRNLKILNLRSLYLNNCPQISMGSLRRLVEDRNAGWTFEAEADPEEDCPPSEFEDIMSEFYSEILYDDGRLACPTGLEDPDPELWDKVSNSSERAAEDDPHDQDYLPTDELESDSLSDEDTNSDFIHGYSTLRKIVLSGRMPEVTEDDVTWFEERGVSLEIRSDPTHFVIP
ncbi:hypothetical protein DFP72DRAFT_1052205 [Ephemerocybe angulata]|uniref:Uncharacterized protein n=1 Tax=Ephemerocybe angulata TaxID=980116 RepID=A0A8H6HC29_9AGAR|nr:hypothetical protein DFP72DRAFT_1052205 [Tulosesus angulatus]